jgi:hypothetical protein
MKNIICECGGDVLKYDDGYQCTKCKLKVYNKFMGKDLSFVQIQNLFFQEGIEFSNIKSKDGYRINAVLYANDVKYF